MWWSIELIDILILSNEVVSFGLSGDGEGNGICGT